MKFLIAPESRRAMVSALFDFECIKTCSIIDFLADRNTSWSQYCLSSANLIRHLENPGPLLCTSGLACLSDHSGASRMWLGHYLGGWMVGGEVECQSYCPGHLDSVHCLFVSLTGIL